MTGFLKLFLKLSIFLAAIPEVCLAQLNDEQKRIVSNVEYLIQQIPIDLDIYKRPIYGSTPAQKALDACDYDWDKIAKDYRQGKVTRAQIPLFRNEENDKCQKFPQYVVGEDSAKELLLYQKSVLKLFGDPELVRLEYKCSSDFHSRDSMRAMHEQPEAKVHAYFDDCLNHGYPFMLWNSQYSRAEEVFYAKLANYAITRILLSKDRLLNTWMFTVSLVFDPGSISILSERDLTERLFDMDERRINLSLNIISSSLIDMGTRNFSKASLDRLHSIALGAVHRLAAPENEEVSYLASTPLRIISSLININHYSPAEMEKLTADPAFHRAGYRHDVPRTIGDYYLYQKDYKKASRYYQRYQQYQKEFNDSYFKDDIASKLCLTAIGMGEVSDDCLTSIRESLAESRRIIRENLETKIHSTSMANLSKLTVLQQDTIELNARIRQYFIAMLVLACIMAVLILKLRRTNKKIKEQKDSIRHILDEIDEIILKFDASGRALPYSSSAASKIFPNIETMTVYQWIDTWFELPSDAKSLIQEVLKSVINEPSIAWELNSDHLPREVKFGGQPYAITWTPVFRQDKTDELLISARNLSEFREAEHLKWEQTLLLSLLSGGDRSQRWIKDLPNRLEGLASFLDTKVLARQVHTIKGEARSLHLAPIVEACHQLEQTLKDEPTYQFALQQLRDSTRNAMRLLSNLNPEKPQDRPETLFESLERMVVESRQTLLPLGFQLQCRLAQDIQSYNEPVLRLLNEILLHALSNSLDHGFIRPRAKGHKVPDCVQIDIQIQGTVPHLQIIIDDNGWGIDEKVLKDRALERQWQPKPGRPWTDIVFESGVSTAHETVSLRSGRGVGLSAVQQAAEELGLRPELSNREDGQQGTRLSIKAA